MERTEKKVEQATPGPRPTESSAPTMYSPPSLKIEMMKLELEKEKMHLEHDRWKTERDLICRYGELDTQMITLHIKVPMSVVGKVVEIVTMLTASAVVGRVAYDPSVSKPGGYSIETEDKRDEKKSE